MLPNPVLFKAMSLHKKCTRDLHRGIYLVLLEVHRPAVLNLGSTAIEKLVCERHPCVCLTVKLAAGGDNNTSLCHRRRYNHLPDVI